VPDDFQRLRAEQLDLAMDREHESELAAADRLDEAIRRVDAEEERAEAGEALTLCHDCGVDAWYFEESGVMVHEDFYVGNALWDAVCPDDDVIRGTLGDSEYGVGQFALCIGCFERRLGRALTRADLTSEPATLYDVPPSRRYLNRWSRS
jgi:hypothetical protein